jgi:hypothetical protein
VIFNHPSHRFHSIYGTIVTIAVVNTFLVFWSYNFPSSLNPLLALSLSAVITSISLWSVFNRVNKLKQDVYRAMKPVRQQQVAGHDIGRTMTRMQLAKQELGEKKWASMTTQERTEYVNAKSTERRPKKKPEDAQEETGGDK